MSRETQIFDKNTGFQLHVNFKGYLINLMNELWEEVKKYRSEKIITKYNYLEELKHEYIHRKELSYSEKLIIEDFYDWLINSYLSGTQCL